MNAHVPEMRKDARVALPWLTVFEKASRALVALSMRLRLSPQARAPNNPGSKQPPPPSYYDTMRAQDDETN
jgi:hypothetical protein